MNNNSNNSKYIRTHTRDVYQWACKIVTNGQWTFLFSSLQAFDM